MKKTSKTKKSLILVMILICSLFSSFFGTGAYIKSHDASSGTVEYGAGIYSSTQENCTGSPVFIQELLYALDNGWNEVNLSYGNLSCCADDSPEVVFESIYEEVNWVFEDVTYLNWEKDELGNTLHHILPDTLYYVKIDRDCTLTIPFDNITVYRTVGATTEKNNFSSDPSYSHLGNVTLKIPVSDDVKGIIDVTNNTCGTTATEVNNTDELVNNTFWYDSVDQFVHIRTNNISFATVTYYFDDYDSGGEEWETTPEDMVDGNISTSAAADDATDIQLLNESTCSGSDLGTITKVELRARTFNVAGTGHIDLRSIFSGGDGDNHQLTTTGVSAWSSWHDITSDTNAPSSWTWNNVTNLDCDVELTRTAGVWYCAQVEIRVTYISIFVNWTVNCSYGLPTNFVANPISISTINLTWTKSSFASHTYIVRKTGDYPISRTDGINIYNDTGTTFLDDTLLPAVAYYYSIWGYNTTWGYSATYTTVSNYTGPANPSNADYTFVGADLNISWNMGQNASTTVIQRRTDGYPTDTTDGTNIYNGSGLYYVDTNILQAYYYTLFSWDTITNLYSVGVNLGALIINCYDEETNDSLYFDIFVSNQDGSQTYESLDNTNPHYLDISQLPTGDDIKITVSAASNYSEKSEISYWNIDENYTITYIVLSQVPDSKSTTNVTCINESDEAYSYPPFTLDGDLITILPDDADNFTKIFVNYTHEEYSSRLYYRDIVGSGFGFSFLNAYLPPTEDKQLYLLEVIDEASNKVSDAHIEVKRSVNGTYVIVSRLLTDANGQADLDLISDRSYIFIISKTGYITENASWTPGTEIFTHTFKIIWEVIPFEPDTFGDIISFYGTLYVNNTMMVTFYDLDNAMTDSHFIIYEDYNDTLTYMGEYNGTTSNDIVFWINVDNATRLHIIVLYMNHSTLGEVINYRVVVYPVHVDRDEGTWLENLIISVVGEFSFGYIVSFLWYLPCVLLIVGMASIKHPGIGILGAGLYSIWITWYLEVPGEAKVLAFASIAIVTGFITLFLVKGKEAIH